LSKLLKATDLSAMVSTCLSLTSAFKKFRNQLLALGSWLPPVGLPPKRKPWESEDSRMDIFDAMELSVVFRMRGK